MFANLQYILQHNCQIKLNKPVLMGVSGGPDSMCLLDLMWRLGYPVVVAHLNHGLRPSAQEEAEFVQREADKRQLRAICHEINVSEYASRQHISVEEAARIVRYRFLFEQARRIGAQAVLVAHTANDQVETVLMHLLRGSGLAGLRGMPYRALPSAWDAEIPLVRPLLGYWREEIQSYLDESGIQTVLDETNQDTGFFRNRLRHELIPYLETYNPRLQNAVFRLADVLQGDYEIVEAAIDSAWNECCVTSGTGFVGFDYDLLSKQSIGVQRGIFRKGIGLLRTSFRDIDFDLIERCLEFARSSEGGQVNLPAKISLYKQDKTIWVVLDKAQLPSVELPQLLRGKEQSLDIPGTCELQNGWVFRANVVNTGTFDANIYENPDPFQAWVAAEKLSNSLLLRVRRAGDRFRPLGMSEGSIKISDYMINHKIPRRARDLYPLIYSGEEIVWVPGFQIGDHFRVTPATRSIIHLRMRREIEDK